MNALDSLTTSPHYSYKKLWGQERRISTMILGINRLRDVLISDETLFLVFDISSQTDHHCLVFFHPLLKYNYGAYLQVYKTTFLLKFI